MRGSGLTVVLTVCEYQIQISILIQIVLEYPLKDTLFGNVDILTAVTESASAKSIETFCYPFLFSHTDPPFPFIQYNCYLTKKRNFAAPVS